MAGLIKHLIIAALSVLLPVCLAAGADGSVWRVLPYLDQPPTIRQHRR